MVVGLQSDKAVDLERGAKHMLDKTVQAGGGGGGGVVAYAKPGVELSWCGGKKRKTRVECWAAVLC